MAPKGSDLSTTAFYSLYSVVARGRREAPIPEIADNISFIIRSAMGEQSSHFADRLGQQWIWVPSKQDRYAAHH
jgi:hypothetical protein